jgi:hypothetical protein
MLACGSVEGDVYGADATAAQRVPDIEILAVRKTDSLMTALEQFCLDVKADDARRKAERARLQADAQRLRDSASVLFGIEYESPRWKSVMGAATAAWDSSTAIPIAGADPVFLAQEVAVKRTQTDANGHYRLSALRAGSYFLVPVMRTSQYAPVQWYKVSVWLGTKRFDATENDGWAGCYLTGKDQLELGSSR